MAEITQLRQVCERAARAGAEQLMSWRGRFTAREKSARDMVTDADIASQQAVYEVIRSSFAEHGFLGEEDPDPRALESDYCWVVDPLDGTTNYVHDFPCYAVSVAVASRGQVVAGCVLDPMREECFTAAEGQGSTLNGKRIAVSETTNISESLLAVSFPPHVQTDSPDIQAFLQIAPRCRAVRRTGSAALNLAYVACGRLDSHWAHFIHSWDSAAGVLLVQEAGGQVSASSGARYSLADGNYFVSATSSLHEALRPLVTRPQ